MSIGFLQRSTRWVWFYRALDHLPKLARTAIAGAIGLGQSGRPSNVLVRWHLIRRFCPFELRNSLTNGPLTEGNVLYDACVLRAVTCRLGEYIQSW